MGSEDLLLIASLLLMGLAVYSFVSSLLQNNTDESVLAWASGDEPVKSKSGFLEFSRPLVHNFTIQHAVRIKSPTMRKRIERTILISGLQNELNVDEYIGLQILWGVMAPAVLFLLNFALELGYPDWFCLALGAGGFMFPSLHASTNRKIRTKAILRDLPFFIDILALSTEAGLDFIAAVQRIIDKAEGSVLGEEFRMVLRDIKLGSSRADAFKKLSQRLEINEIRSFVGVLVDADATGASIAQVLKDQSEQMRLNRFVRAEKAGAQASQAMLIPLMFFILPAVFIMVFAPVILQFMYGGGG